MNYRHLILTSLAGMALNLTPALAQETKKPEPKQETGTKPVAAAPAEAAPEAPAPKESAELLGLLSKCRRQVQRHTGGRLVGVVEDKARAQGRDFEVHLRSQEIQHRLRRNEDPGAVLFNDIIAWLGQ